MVAYVLSYIAAITFGGAIGISELISRYKDSPINALKTLSAWIYVLINAGASGFALWLIQKTDWLSDLGGKSVDQHLIMQTLVASFGAMAFFRASFFTVRVGTSDIAIGPAGFLQVVLAAADRATDRMRARPRAKSISEIMNNISFAKSQEALPSLCFGLMQNVGSEEIRNFGLIVKDLQNSKMDDAFKSNILGLALLNIVGESVLREAVSVLRKLISDPPRRVVNSLFTLQLIKNGNFAQDADQLLDQCLLITGQAIHSNYRVHLKQTLAAITGMKMDNTEKMMMLSSMIISEFSEEILQYVLKSLPANATVSAL